MASEHPVKLFQRIEWLDALNTDHPEIDDAHRQLIKDTNTILAILSKGQPWRELPALVQRMRADCSAHFRREEQILEEQGYPGAAAHAMEHRRIEKNLAETAAEIERAVTASTCELALYFRSLLVDHFLQYDLRYKSHLLYTSGR